MLSTHRLVLSFAPLLILCACAGAGKIDVELTGVTVKACPAGIARDVLVSANNNANTKGQCILLVGTTRYGGTIIAKNVDVFGRVTDANGTQVLTRRRVGTLAEVKPGNNPFQLQFEAPGDARMPFTVTNIQAKGFSEKVQTDQPDFSAGEK
ncbi:hypothetical protein [Anthocerotibacter panamensis]|uniref:hypothetical protein n=1 Tax=Anthocerotibacter panamensis TaxID=2857077 RepID=UPI001C407DFB|nr:hypothetical protein [Anthocerotibacter panamensis]